MPARLLTSVRSKKGGIGPQPIQAVLYVRVSSKEQEKEGFSIAAQLRLLREYVARLGFVLVKEFVDYSDVIQHVLRKGLGHNGHGRAS